MATFEDDFERRLRDADDEFVARTFNAAAQRRRRERGSHGTSELSQLREELHRIDATKVSPTRADAVFGLRVARAAVVAATVVLLVAFANIFGTGNVAPAATADLVLSMVTLGAMEAGAVAFASASSRRLRAVDAQLEQRAAHREQVLERMRELGDQAHDRAQPGLSASDEMLIAARILQERHPDTKVKDTVARILEGAQAGPTRSAGIERD